MASLFVIVALSCLLHPLAVSVSAFILQPGATNRNKTSTLTAEPVYSWKSLDYEWPSPGMKQQYIKSGKFIVHNNVITGVKVYRNSVYVTVPRWRPGVPATLNEVVEGAGSPVLRPFPSWQMQLEGDCSALQYVQSMEVDPATGYMWIIDVGRRNIFEAAPINACPAKLVIWDIDNAKEVDRYVFPESVVPRASNFLNDIVLDRVNGTASLAYISDARVGSLVVFDRRSRHSYQVKSWSMAAELGSTVIHVGNTTLDNTTPIDGVAMSPDFRFLYYNALAATALYRVPTSVLRSGGRAFEWSLQRIGRKPSMSDGIACGKNNLYFGALELNALYRFPMGDSLAESSSSLSQPEVVAQGPEKQWIDTLAFDGKGNIWFTANKLQDFFTGKMNFVNPTSPNMYVWRVHVGEKGYLDAN